MKSQELYDKYVCKVNTTYGAPMGRMNDLHPGLTLEDIPKCYDRKVPLSNGGYDKGGVYWGFGVPLRMNYSEHHCYFYRSYRPIPLERIIEERP